MAKGRNSIELIRTFCQKTGKIFNYRYYIFNFINSAIDQNGKSIAVVDNTIVIDPNVITSFIVSNNIDSLRFTTEKCGCNFTINLISTGSSCLGEERCITAQITNGKAPYIYRWFIDGIEVNNQSNKHCFINMKPTHKVGVIITDSNDCVSSYTEFSFNSRNCESVQDEVTLSYGKMTLLNNGTPEFKNIIFKAKVSNTSVRKANTGECVFPSDIQLSINGMSREGFMNQFISELATNDGRIRLYNKYNFLNCSERPHSYVYQLKPKEELFAATYWKDDEMLLLAGIPYTNKLSLYTINLNISNGQPVFKKEIDNYTKTDSTGANLFIRHGNKIYLLSEWDDGGNKLTVINIVNDELTTYNNYFDNRLKNYSDVQEGNTSFLMSTKLGLLGYNKKDFYLVQIDEIPNSLNITEKKLLNPDGLYLTPGNFSINKI